MEPHSIYRTLVEEIGSASIATQYTELLLREFDKNYPHINKSKLLELSNAHSLIINAGAPANIKNVLASSYIVRVHTVFEKFLSDYLKLSDLDTSRIDPDESTLKKIVFTIWETEKDTSENKILFYICNYYRLIRNKTVHKSKNNDSAELKNSLNKAKNYGEDFLKTKRYGNLKALNDEANLTFDDFVLYSRCIQELSKNIYNAKVYKIEKIISDNLEVIYKWKKQYTKNFNRSTNKVISYLSLYYPESFLKENKNSIRDYMSH